MKKISKWTLSGLVYGLVTGLFYYSCTMVAGATPLSLICVLGVASSLNFFSLFDNIFKIALTPDQSYIVTPIIHVVISTFLGFLIGIILSIFKRKDR